MRLKNGTLFTKKELVGIINALLSIEHGFAKSNYLMKFIEKKQEELFDEVDKKLAILTHLDVEDLDFFKTQRKLTKEINSLHNEVRKWGEVVVVEGRKQKEETSC